MSNSKWLGFLALAALLLAAIPAPPQIVNPGGSGAPIPFSVVDIPPAVASLTTLNFTGCSDVQNSDSSIYVTCPTGGGAVVRGLYEKPGTSTFTRIFGFTADYGSGAFPSIGAFLYESATDKAIVFVNEVRSVTQPPYRGVDYYSNSSTFAATLSAYANWNQSGPLWMRVRLDATNIYFDWSTDGRNWKNLYNEAKAAHFTTAPDSAGFYEEINGGLNPIQATVFSWGP